MRERERQFQWSETLKHTHTKAADGLVSGSIGCTFVMADSIRFVCLSNLTFDSTGSTNK